MQGALPSRSGGSCLGIGGEERRREERRREEKGEEERRREERGERRSGLTVKVRYLSASRTNRSFGWSKTATTWSCTKGAVLEPESQPFIEVLLFFDTCCGSHLQPRESDDCAATQQDSTAAAAHNRTTGRG